MSIVEYEIDGEKFWRFYLNKRSPRNPNIRVQRTVTGFSSYEDAAKAEKKHLTLVMREIGQLETKGCTWGELVQKWELFHRMYPSQKLSPVTIHNYVLMVRMWTKAWWNLDPQTLTRGDGRNVFHALELEDYPAKYFIKLRTAINKVFYWGVEEKLIGTARMSPMDGLDITGNKQDKLTEILSFDQIKILLKTAKEKKHPWYPVWAFTLLTGCRSGEANGLRREDVELIPQSEVAAQNLLPPEKRHYGIIQLTRAWQAREGKIGPLKNREWRIVPISSELYALIRELMEKDFGSDPFGHYLLPRFSMWDKGQQAEVLRQFCDEIKIPSVRFHTLRACFATHLLSQGVTATVVMKICGWKELKTMERYIRLAGVDTRGATEGLKFVPEEQVELQNVVNLVNFRSSPKDLA